MMVYLVPMPVPSSRSIPETRALGKLVRSIREQAYMNPTVTRVAVDCESVAVA